MSDKQKPPAYQWYPKDYESDEAVKLMTYEEEGIYRRLLDHQALHGSLPLDPKRIALLVPKIRHARFLKLWPAMCEKFKPVEGGRRVNRRLERSQREYADYLAAQSDNGKKGADKRWHRHSTATGTAIATPIAKVTPATATATATAKEHERARDDGSALGRVVDAFQAHWKRLYGHESFLHLKPFQQVQLDQQIDKCGEQKFLAAMAAYFATDDAYVRKARHPLGLFLSNPTKYLAKEASVRSSGTLSPEETRDAQRRLREQAS